MNKNKIIMASIGGVGLLAALVVGYLAYDGMSEKAEKLDDLETKKSQVKSINSGKISPEQAAVEAIDANRKKLAEWRAGAFALASRGDIGVNSVKFVAKDELNGDGNYYTDTIAVSSDFSNLFYFKKLGTTQNVGIKDGRLYWDPVVGASAYKVKVNVHKAGSAIPDVIELSVRDTGSETGYTSLLHNNSDCDIKI